MLVKVVPDITSHNHWYTASSEWCDNNFESVILKHMDQIEFMSISDGIAVLWVPKNSFDD